MPPEITKRMKNNKNDKFQKLRENIIDEITEEQAKLGYMKEPIRLYYPLGTLNHLIGQDGFAGEKTETPLAKDVKTKIVSGEICGKNVADERPWYGIRNEVTGRLSADEMQKALEDFAKSVKDTLGDIRISHKGERFCIFLPDTASEYVHENAEVSRFIFDLIELIRTPGTTMEKLKELFAAQGIPYEVKNIKSDDFDVMMRFTEGSDRYYYCFKDEGGGHIIYHRFMPEDYAEMEVPRVENGGA